ncbi:MAG: DUF4432 family protein [Ruminococcaceae bacterium]|nr:DUF4432 family protein [Oscillospiraceae bacterium]
MAKINGKELTKQELLKRAGNPSQLCGIRKISFEEGKARGLSAFEVKTGSGFCFTIAADKCMDILEASYKGVNLSFLGKAGPTAPQYYNSFENEFGQTMTGGLMFTCGLQNSGGGCRDNQGVWHSPHGRAAFIPAEQVYGKSYWSGDDLVIEAGGVMRENLLFGHNLSLTRKITAKAGENKFILHDTLENLAAEPNEFIILYHFNLGYPMLDEMTKLILPEDTESSARTEAAEKGIDKRFEFSAPIDGFFEHCFFHVVKGDDGFAEAKVENPSLGFGISLKYSVDTLPVLTEWKSMRSGDYALGLEPGNGWLCGRKLEQDNGTIQTIAPFSKIEYTLEFSVYDL